jgi:ubiquitin-activating enzyme E1
MIGVSLLTLYSSFLSSEKRAERMKMKLSEIVEKIKKEKLPKHVKYLILSVSCTDSDGSDIDIPLVKYIL